MIACPKGLLSPIVGRALFKAYNRRCSNEQKVFKTLPQCTINGFLSYNAKITPNANTDAVILKSSRPIVVNQIGSTVNLTTARDAFDPSIKIELLVPIKANLNITSLGSLEVFDLQGDGIRLFSETSSVTIGNVKSSEVQVGTNDEDIITQGTLEAGRINLLCRRKGSIKAENVKTLGLKMDTNEGDISMDACYSKEGYFVSRTGNVLLKNVHNRCRIEILKRGTVKLVGLDGALDLQLQNGEADLQIEKLHDDSDIVVREEGEITLRINARLLEHCEILIWSKGCYVNEQLPYVDDTASNLTTVRDPNTKPEHTLRVRCERATCNVRVSSWIDMVGKELADKQKQSN